ncbi:MAG: ABC transporter ATP-binding protein [Planctomycetes bacterium]|nr:ABC transporter ATP-binding protein [Planctomycetota bacterium]
MSARDARRDAPAETEVEVEVVEGARRARREPIADDAFWPTLKRLMRYVFRYRGLLVSVILLGSLTAAFEKSMLLAIGPVEFVLFPEEAAARAKKKAEGQANDVVSQAEEAGGAGWLAEFSEGFKQKAFAFFEVQGSDTEDQRFWLLIGLVVTIIFIALITGVMEFFFHYTSRKLNLRIAVDLRNDLARHLLHLPISFHGKSKLGDLVSRISNDVQSSLKSLNLMTSHVIQEPAGIAMNLAIAFVVNPWMTLLIIVLMPLIALPFLVLGKRVRRGSRRSLSVLGESTKIFTEMLSGIRVVKAFRREEAEARAFAQQNRGFLRRSMSMVRARALSESALVVVAYGGISLVMLAIGYAQIYSADLKFKDFPSFALYIGALTTTYTHIKRISRGYNSLEESVGALSRLFEIQDQKSNLLEAPDAVGIERLQRSLYLKDVHFAYDGSGEGVLHGIDIEIPVGSRVALVGPSGAGKSTLLDLVARFYDPTGGAILADGIDLRKLRIEAWLGRIAFVNQAPFLFHASIRDNLRYGKADATDEEIIAAAKAAAIHDFVQSLPEGYDTLVGERGARISGGQMQRITIARAILRNADLLLLDEATSSLDTEAEKAVQEALDHLMVGRTSIIVAHRLSTVRNADRIFVLEQGRIVEQGRHDELYERGGVYRRLYDMQFRES